MINGELSAHKGPGLTPEQLKEIDQLYLAKCEEVNRLKAELEEYKRNAPAITDTSNRTVILTCEITFIRKDIPKDEELDIEFLKQDAEKTIKLDLGADSVVVTRIQEFIGEKQNGKCE